MIRKNASKRPKVSLVKDVPVVKLKAGVKTKAWHPTKEILNEHKLAQALFAALKDDDIESFKEILMAHLHAKVKTKEAKLQNLPARTMYEALSEKGNPSLKTIAKIVKMACAS